jgi:hypothetical protein
MAASAWAPLGVVMHTALTAGSPAISCKLAAALHPFLVENAAQASGEREYAEISCASGTSEMALEWNSAIMPVPMMANPMGVLLINAGEVTQSLLLEKS